MESMAPNLTDVNKWRTNIKRGQPDNQRLGFNEHRDDQTSIG